MTGPVGIIRRAVSFIFDPVPRVDRKPTITVDMKLTGVEQAQAEAGRVQAALYRVLLTLKMRPKEVWLPPVDWSSFATAAERHPRSSPARLRPYDWQAEHAWPVEGWVL
jgi:hypothetical protein